ncbi:MULTISPECIES: 2-phosphosulfolactate phosphatase [Paenibacillus]|uniref:Probable 2-phosphosulfolactate phosphatase n=1 Tax=Paenibacillus arenosi TaxID=2774142 RepID=A0ABR9AUG6_9BACL|nr:MULTISPECIES: 2-phosphosulfolactate phosphatase [Paenibacillus]MBD8497745.1 2-phosphosulfolactate phosphatase [Paenibacillus arenosi]
MQLQVDVIASIGEARAVDLNQHTVIVIDVLRATSTIITALANGAASVLPVETVGQARQQYAEGDVLGGERFCKKIAGFDLGNSPHEYTSSLCLNKRIVLTTSNGTRAIQKAVRAEHVLAGAFLNASACAQLALSLRRNVALLCTGTQDAFAFEDALCAGMILHEMIADHQAGMIITNDLGMLALSAYKQHKGHIHDAVRQSSSGKRLLKLGFGDDVEYCSLTNQVHLVPTLHEHLLIPHRQSS